MARRLRRQASASRASHSDIPATSASSTASPAWSDPSPATARTRSIAHAVRPSSGPGSGHAASSSVPAPDAARCVTGWSSRAAARFAAAMRPVSAAGTSVLGPPA